MKHCPECNRNYADPTLSFCLQDGAPLIFGQSVEESSAAILSGEFPSEAPTRQIDPHMTAPTESFPSHGSAGRPSMLNRKTTWVVGGLAIVLAAAVFGFRYFTAAPVANQIKSVAVLPFENGSGSAEMDFLSDGLSATLIDKLSELSQLKVIARTSSFKYRDPNPDIQDIAAKLGADAIVMGKVAKVGDQLSIRVELVDVANNKQIWGEQFNRPFSQVINIPQELAQNVSNKLRLKLTGAQEVQLAKKGTDNPQAYELYLRAKNIISKGSGVESSKQVNRMFQQAVAVDPNFAAAWAALGMNYLALAGISEMNPKEAYPLAESAIEKALTLDPNLAEAHNARARYLYLKWEWQSAEAEFKRALDLNPGLVEAHIHYSFLLSTLARHDEAVAEASRAREIDPISPRAHFHYSYRLHSAKRYDESIAAANKTLELEPDFDPAYLMLGYNYAAMGRYADALQALQKAVELGDTSPSTKIYLGAAYAKLGDRDKALSILKELQSGKVYVSPGELPVLLVALGDHEAAFSSFEKAYAEHDLQLTFLKIDTSFDPIRNDPRFRELLKRVGLPPD